MSKLKISVWIGVIANTIVGLAGWNLSIIFDNIFDSTIRGGFDALPVLSKNYIGHQQWFLAGFTFPLILGALVLSIRSTISFERTLIFGALTILNISLQILVAVVALGNPFIPVL